MLKFRTAYIRFIYIIFAQLLLIPFLWSCVKVEGPTNLEPSLILMDATDITRNTAKVSVEIDNPGTASLSYIRFHYVMGTDNGLVTEDIKPTSNVVECELTGLKPGTEYKYYAEAGTATASIRSDDLSFTTVSNNIPKVSNATTLSTGPTGIIVEFTIEDDGGEEITYAGCEISKNNAKISIRVNLKPAELTTGKHHLAISGLSPETNYRITPFAANKIGEDKGMPLEFTTRNGIVLREPGVLAELFDDTPIELKTLTISGDMNGTDFRFLRKVVGAPIAENEKPIQSQVTELYLSDVNIVEGGLPFDGSRFTETNTISTGLFANCAQLKSIILPNSTKIIQRDAFSNSPQLESLNIPLDVSEITPSLNCPTLKSIQVSESNNNFSDYEGVLFNKGGTAIIWFPEGKTGHFKLPSTITTIGKNAFNGTHITSLAIPESVTTIENGAFYGSSLQEI